MTTSSAVWMSRMRSPCERKRRDQPCKVRCLLVVRRRRCRMVVDRGADGEGEVSSPHLPPPPLLDKLLTTIITKQTTPSPPLSFSSLLPLMPPLPEYPAHAFTPDESLDLLYDRSLLPASVVEELPQQYHVRTTDYTSRITHYST